MAEIPRSLAQLNAILQHRDPYHKALSMPWRYFFLISMVAFFIINGFFGYLYMLDPGGIANLNSDQFIDYFFFSIESISTIGYGHTYPQSTYTHWVMTFQVFVGVMNIALATGVVFAKFSLPTAKIIFSDKLLLTKYDGKPCLLLRVANQRNNQIVDAKVSLNLIWNETTAEGVHMRRSYTMVVKKRHTPLIALSWLIAHEIDQQSPLSGRSIEDLKNNGAIIIATVVGIDGTLSQNIYAQTTFTPSQIVKDHQFVDMLKIHPNGQIEVEHDKISDIRPNGSDR